VSYCRERESRPGLARTSQPIVTLESTALIGSAAGLIEKPVFC
jgi:hypothetical protein